MIYEEEFREWLVSSKGLSRRVAADNLSRLKRAIGFVGKPEPYSKVISKLAQCEQYSSLSMSVRSQLKCAVRYYIEFVDYRRD